LFSHASFRTNYEELLHIPNMRPGTIWGPNVYNRPLFRCFYRSKIKNKICHCFCSQPTASVVQWFLIANPEVPGSISGATRFS
jgi:hypothetical protein